MPESEFSSTTASDRAPLPVGDAARPRDVGRARVTEEHIRVLLVEDDEDDFVVTRALLAEATTPYFDLQWARTLKAGLEKLAENTVGVVLLDLSLPDSQGLDTFRRIHEAVPRLPVILLTGLDDETVGVRAVHQGAQDYLAKGQINRAQLVRSIRYAIERKDSEEQLKRYQNQLEELVAQRTAKLIAANKQLEREIVERKQAERELRKAFSRLEAYDRARTEFVSNVSHELRSPLASIGYAADNMLKGVVGPVPEKGEEYVRMIIAECRRLGDTVADILDMSRLDAKTLSLHEVTIPLAGLVESTIEELHVQAQMKQQHLVLQTEDHALFVRCDAQKIERTVINVVGNAMKYTQKGGTVSVSLSRNPYDEGLMLIKVVDDGPGIDPEHIAHVTERYYRVGEHISGTGLGLALSKEILEMHGGGIDIQSPPQGRRRGTEVRMALPIVAPPLVLVVDGDEVRLTETTGYLAGEGYNVVQCPDAAAALDRLDEGRPELIIIDLRIDGMPGIELIARVKADPDCRRVPMIGLSAGPLNQSEGELLRGFGIPVLVRSWSAGAFKECLEFAVSGRRYLA